MTVLLLTSCFGLGSQNKQDSSGSDTNTISNTGGTSTNTNTSTNTGNVNCPHLNEVVDKAVAATCTEPGLSRGSHCGDCGAVIVERFELPPKGHKVVNIPDVAPTCTENGSQGGTHCKNCYEVMEAPTIVPCTGHTEQEYTYIAPTCVSYGYQGGSYCTTCSAVITERTLVPKTGHTEVATEDILATCTQDGYINGIHCDVCKIVIVEPTLVPKTGHTEILRTEDIEATCITNGYSGGSYCKDCGIDIQPPIVTPPSGHKSEVLSGYPATCSKEGLSDGIYCSVCDKIFVEQVVLDKTSHHEVITQAIAPTCQSVGYTEKRQCSVCGKVTLESKQLPKSDHTPVVDKAVAATCSSTGLTEGSHCSVCDTVIVAQQTVAKNSEHVFAEFATVTTSPSFSSNGSGTLACTKCSYKKSITFDKLVGSKLTKDDIFSIDTDQYNPAYDNRWKVVDGNTKVSNLWVSGDDWFGNQGEKLVITLKQEMALTTLKVYTAGNETYAKLRVRDSAGKITLEKTIKANGASYGGDAQVHTLASGSNIKAYTIEIELTNIKGAGTFKVSEVEMTAGVYNEKMPHTHHYREFLETSRVATCQVTGLDVYTCFCGKENVVETAKGDHAYNTLLSTLSPTCQEKGVEVYECDCGAKNTVETEAYGHVYHKLVEYRVMPTTSTNGVAIYKCNTCNQRAEVKIDPLAIEEVNYLSVESIENGKVTLKFNIYGTKPFYEVRYSESEITEENYSAATIIEAEEAGENLITLTLNLDASLEKGYYVAIKPYSGTNYGKMATIRVGGNEEIPIDYDKAQIYHGEVLSSFRPMFDDDIATRLGVIFPNSGDTEELYGSSLRPIIDLQYMHYVTKLSLYYAESGAGVQVRWSDTPVDFMSEDSLWDGSALVDIRAGWNNIEINESTRYIQIIFTDGEAPYEVMAYGYQCGKGDTIATEKGTLPTIGEMLGMCGFVAGGGGNTPIDSVICTTVLREYHNFGWSYTASNYGNKASNFINWMGDFDKQYRDYKLAGINVIPCVQWSLGNGETISYKVGSDNTPLYDSEGKLIRATFWERFNPHTYFVYADNMFAFSARYGRNTSAELLAIAQLHCTDKPSVGQGTVEWIEMGNEPEGGWNGIHNYLSAYQLAAATSAAYDGHCSTMVATVPGGYYLGGKNADPTMKLAMAGVSGVSNEYITALIYWMRANRIDGSTAFDAFNVHNYMTKQITLPNGSTANVGISPEEANIAGVLAQLIEIRDKYYPEKEVWITEFGWDTNQSYATATSAHAYGEYTGRQVQAMWLTRAYLILSATGIDKADMYMCEDTGVEELSVGKYGTCGVIAFEYDENGNTVEVKKDSYYYLYTLKNTLGGYSFDSQIEAYDENVWVYKYKTEDGKTAYAVWCGTSDGTKVENYQLAIDGDSATLVEAVYGDIDGVQTSLTADEYGYVSVNVSENPVYILVD